MFLRSLQLMHFKNYAESMAEFDAHINCLVGENGVGKTNMLDAIHLLCLGRSAFAQTDQLMVQHGAAFYMAKGEFEDEAGNHPISCSFQNGRKMMRDGRKEYERMSDHLGRFPVVLLAPSDTDLAREGGETRRKYFDTLLCQLDKAYLLSVSRYAHALKQRNALLKQFAETNYIDHALLEPYNLMLSALGLQICRRREACLQELIPIFQEHYKHIAQGKEAVGITYQSDCLSSDFETRLSEGLQRDLALQRTYLGIHRDDFLFEIDGYPLKKFGSQGQQKSFVMALKLAQFDFMSGKMGKKPILLMDDIFDKLDDARIAQLLRLLGSGRFGQVFITDARPERSINLLQGLPAQVIHLHK